MLPHVDTAVLICLKKINNSVILLALSNNVYLFTEERLGRYHYKDAKIQCSSMINDMPPYDKVFQSEKSLFE